MHNLGSVIKMEAGIALDDTFIPVKQELSQIFYDHKLNNFSDGNIS
jgi:hypothetical protein